VISNSTISMVTNKN